MKSYKFLDVGCKWGSSFSIAKRFGYTEKEGIGIDINPKNVKRAQEKGFNVILGDATNIQMEDNLVELVILNHVLEHLPSENLYKKAISETLRVSSKWVYIATPIFDYEEYLNSLGLKTFYSDWKGHSAKIHLKDLLKIIQEYDYNYDLTYVKKIENSFAPEIHPICSPPDQHEYNSLIHPSKKFIIFNKEMYREFSLIIQK
jgi:ubiquinone/menaquinone biosynthesis C-methylase UbiE